MLLWLLFNPFAANQKAEKMKFSEYIAYFEQEKVESYTLDLNNGALKLLLREQYRTDVNKDNKVDEKDVLAYTVPDVGSFINMVTPLVDDVNRDDNADNDVTYDWKPLEKQSFFVSMLPYLLMMGISLLALWLIMRRSMGDGSKMFSFGKTRLKTLADTKRKTTFADVAGADEEKEELREIVDFLKAPKKYQELGARVPKGVLLVGPPGTGKTLLARAVAGEANVPFFSISGSDFVEMYVGVGASRVRDMFEQAKKNAPCITFIDEIDAVGRQRGAGLGGGHDEREQTLNQLLVEMDGFGANEGIILIAATNRPDVLDRALMRPGRFDRQIVVGYPDVKGREEILRVHAKGKPLAPDVELATVAKSTAGFTGADLENLLNEAALLAARKSRHSITMEEIEEATVKVVVGTEKKSRKQTQEERKLTAYHEAGHAVVTYFCPTQDPVHQVSIVPRGMAGGFTMSLPENDRSYRSRNEMLEDLQVLLGGRVAEALTLADISTGASNDIERATDLARSMVTKYGMSDALGPIAFGASDSDEIFLGRDFGHTRNYSEEIAARIDKEIEKIITDAYAKTREKLTRHLDKLEEVAAYLLEHEKMDGDAFKALMEGSSVENASDN
ncbi:MAG: ATP-dependent zinc metalloprotease FtsH [Clostridia bacterium]|nr:ATP-dependent zinc metalloprotease FtsH [Clostridia bacterium]